MKKLIPLLAISMLSSTVFAQNGFYLSPSAGAGIGSSFLRYTAFDNKGNATTNSASSIFSYNFTAGIGYRYKNWRFESGLQYISNGYLLKGLVFGSDFDPSTGTVQFYGTHKTRLNYIGIPLQLSYSIPLSRRLSLVPTAGIIASYALNGTYETQEGGMTRTGSWTKQELDNYGRISIWGQASLHLEYKINEKISLFGGPSFQYLFKSGNGIGQNPYNLHFNAGVKIGL